MHTSATKSRGISVDAEEAAASLGIFGRGSMGKFVANFLTRRGWEVYVAR